MKTFITILLLVTALSSGMASAFLHMQQTTPQEATVLAEGTVVQQALVVSSRYPGRSSHYSNPLLTPTAKNLAVTNRQAPVNMLLLGIFLLSAASNIRRISGAVHSCHFTPVQGINSQLR